MANVADFEIRLDDNLTAPAKRAADGVEQINRSIGKTATRASAFGNIMAGVAMRGLDMLAGAAVRAAGAVLELGKSLAVSVLEGASFVQQSRIAFEQLLHGGEDATQVFNDVRAEAVRLGMNVEDTTHSFQGLLAAQFSVGKAKEMVRMGSDLRAIGASAEEVKRALTAITQIKAKGRLMAEELLQLQEAKISQELVFNAIKDMMGLENTAQVRKTIEAGKVHGDLALEAIARAVKKKVGATELGEAGAAWADRTFAGMAGQMEGRLAIMWQDIGTSLLPSLEALGQRVAKFMSGPGVLARLELFKTVVIGLFQRVVNWVDRNWETIQTVVLGGVDALITAFIWLGKAWDFVVDNWGTIKIVLLGVAAAIGIVVALLAVLAASFLIGVGVIMLVTGLFWKLIWTIGEFVVYVYEAGRSIIDGLRAGIMSGVASVIAVVQGVANTIRWTLMSALGIASPSKVFEKLGAFTAEGLAVGIEASAPRIQTASADMGAVAAGGAAGGVAGGGGGGITINVAVDAPAGADGAKGEEFGDAIAAAIQRRLAPLLEGALLTEGAT